MPPFIRSDGGLEIPFLENMASDSKSNISALNCPNLSRRESSNGGYVSKVHSSNPMMN
jgi:hypothetical protein